MKLQLNETKGKISKSLIFSNTKLLSKDYVKKKEFPCGHRNIPILKSSFKCDFAKFLSPLSRFNEKTRRLSEDTTKNIQPFRLIGVNQKVV